MKVLVLGATGSVGQHIVRLLIERGHEIIALVRNPEKLKSWEGRVRIVKGDALDKDAEWRPDVNLSDIAMPEEDGYSFIGKVRSLPREKGGNRQS